MITKDQAIVILKKWNVTNVEEKLKTDKKAFLNELIVVIHDKVPYQSFTLHMMERYHSTFMRYSPSAEEIDDMCINGIGGNCVFISLFVARLFRALGYAAYVCRATVTRSVSGTHLIVIVKDLEKQGDIHLVDCGLALPTFAAIPLNFKHESPVYRDSFLEYKFIRRGKEILRMHGDGDIVKHDVPSSEPKLDFHVGKWRRYYFFFLEMIECEKPDDLGPPFNFRLLPNAMFVAPRVVRFPGKKAVLILGDRLQIEKDDGSLEVITTMKNTEDILRVYHEHFPSFDPITVIQAYAAWHYLASKL